MHSTFTAHPPRPAPYLATASSAAPLMHVLPQAVAISTAAAVVRCGCKLQDPLLLLPPTPTPRAPTHSSSPLPGVGPGADQL